MEVWNTLSQLAGANGPSGYEYATRDVVSALWQPLCNEIKSDALGNVIGHKNSTRVSEGKPARIMLAAHMDEIAMMVLSIEKRGFLRVTPVGGIDLRQLPSQEVTVHGQRQLLGVVGALPPHLTTEADRNKAPTWDEVFIDVGLPIDTVRELVSPGDLITFNANSIRLLGERAAGKSFDNRVGVCVLSQVLYKLQRMTHAVDVYAVATVQEEVSLRGAITSAFNLMPQAGIAIDVGFGAMPGISEYECIALGKGPGLTLGGNIHPGLRARLVEIAKRENVQVQDEVAPGSSGTDAWGMQVTQAGMPTAVISIPLRYMHSPVECVDLQDISAASRLLAAFLCDLENTEAWGWNNGLA